MPLGLETENILDFDIQYALGHWIVTFKSFGVCYAVFKTRQGDLLWTQTFDYPMEVVPNQKLKIYKPF